MEAAMKAHHQLFVLCGRACVAALALVAVGCLKPENGTPPAASARPSIRTPTLPSATSQATAERAAEDDFFAGWLRAHGETDIVTDARGIGVSGNGTRLRASPYGETPHGGGVLVVETEFRVHLPSGDEIVEYVAGVGASRKAADDDARANFATSTFHVIYRSFINPSDPHQQEEPIVLNGLPRSLVRGDVVVRNFGGGPVDVSLVESQLKDILSKLSLSAAPHWIKIVYQQTDGAPDTVAVTLDNTEHASLISAIKRLPWPRQPGSYTAKQFIVIK
jgi:hypothetical protein